MKPFDPSMNPALERLCRAIFPHGVPLRGAALQRRLNAILNDELARAEAGHVAVANAPELLAATVFETVIEFDFGGQLSRDVELQVAADTAAPLEIQASLCGRMKVVPLSKPNGDLHLFFSAENRDFGGRMLVLCVGSHLEKQARVELREGQSFAEVVLTEDERKSGGRRPKVSVHLKDVE